MITKKLAILFVGSAMFWACSSPAPEAETQDSTPAQEQAEPGRGQSGVVDEVSDPNILAVALGSEDHTTLVAAVKAASKKRIS